MGYESVYDSFVGGHRDNGLVPPAGSGGQQRVGHSEDQNSQVRGSAVMVYTVGSPMLFGLMEAIGVPPDELHDVPKKAHMCHVELTVELAEGSVFLLTAAR